jgi:hypothetical protein
MKGKSRIAIVLAGLILVITSHNIIPHHHHLDHGISGYDCKDLQACDWHDTSGEPIDHCHAFNGIKFIAGIKKWVPSSPDHPVLHGKFTPSAKPVMDLSRGCRIQAIDHPPEILFQAYPSSCGLRAPPPLG